jgi:hypothetical protein
MVFFTPMTNRKGATFNRANQMLANDPTFAAEVRSVIKSLAK